MLPRRKMWNSEQKWRIRKKKERKWTWGDKCKPVHFPSKSVHFPSSEPWEIPLETQLSFIWSQIPLGKAESIFSFLWKYEGF